MRPGMLRLFSCLVVAVIIAFMGCGRRCITCAPPPEQKGPECSFAIAPTTAHFGYNGGTSAVSVGTQSGCQWTASSNAPWVGITGTGPGSVTYAVLVNAGAARTGTMTIAGQTVTVTQDGVPPTPPPPQPKPTPSPTPLPSCTYAVQESPQHFTYQGGSGGFSVSASRSDCPWTAAPSVAWIAITGGSPGSGNGSVSYLVAGNGGSARTGTIRVAGKTVTVAQDGK